MSAVASAGVAIAARLLKTAPAQNIADQMLGTAERRAFDKVCAKALVEAIRQSVPADMSVTDRDHLVTLVERIVADSDLPVLPLPDEAVEGKIASLADVADRLGFDRDSFPVSFDTLMGRMLELVPHEVTKSAALHENPLFNSVMVQNITEMRRDLNDIVLAAQRQRPESIPLTRNLTETLDDASATCESLDRRFLTPDLLLSLLGMPGGHAAACFDAVRPGLSAEVAEPLRRYLTGGHTEPYVSFFWNERADIQRARIIAADSGAHAVNELHLLLAVLEGDSATSKQLTAWLADRHAMVCQAVRHRFFDLNASTPGVVFPPGRA